MPVLDIVGEGGQADLVRFETRFRRAQEARGIVGDAQRAKRRGLVAAKLPNAERLERRHRGAHQRRGAVIRRCGLADQRGLDAAVGQRNRRQEARRSGADDDGLGPLTVPRPSLIAPRGVLSRVFPQGERAETMTKTGISVRAVLALSLRGIRTLSGWIVADIADHTLTHLPPAAARLGALSARPKTIATACVLVLAGAGWIYLGFLAGTSTPQAGNLWSWIGALVPPGGRAAVVRSRVDRSRHADVDRDDARHDAAERGADDPHLCRDRRHRRRAKASMPFRHSRSRSVMRRSGSGSRCSLRYCKSALIRAGLDLESGTDIAAPVSGILFLVAGLYQFSTLKQSCLRVCQRPFPFFFANWRTTTRGVFNLGLRQGLHCLGCCWAMMLLMLAAGVMNAVWMAGLGLVMTLEKMTATPRFSRILGVIFIVVGVAMLVAGAAGLGWRAFA